MDNLSKHELAAEKKEMILACDDIGELRGHLIKGSFTSVDLVLFFAERCFTIGRKMEYTAEEMFEAAFEKAKRCDAERAEGDATSLPYLHGIPISVKDCLQTKGKSSTIGCAFRSEKVATENASCIQAILDAGAIPLVKGSMPFGGLSYHTSNLIWGTAKNYFDPSRSCGGSSGGEAGFVSSWCVPLAIGTDLGGSIRVPAHFNGIIGFKPTQKRLSYRGAVEAKEQGYVMNSAHFMAVAGPLARSTRDCTEFFKLQCDPQ